MKHQKKDLQLFAKTLTEKYLILENIMLKNIVILISTEKKTKLVIIEHLKISNKLSKTIRQAENISLVDLERVSIALYILKQQ